jgi:hypothetical protein
VTDTLDTGQETGEGGNDSANIKHLRERAEAATAAENRAAAAERKLAIIESGIDTSTPMAQFFVEHYDGDITDTAALTAAAKEMGIPLKGETAGEGAGQQGDGAQGEGGQQVNDQANANGGQRQILEPTGTEQRRALAGEDTNPGEESRDPRQVALEQAKSAMEQGATWEAAAGNFVATVANAASRGDRRAIVEEKRGGGQTWQ